MNLILQLIIKIMKYKYYKDKYSYQIVYVQKEQIIQHLK